MSDDKFEKTRLRKADALLKSYSMPLETITINNEEELDNILKNFPNEILVIDFWAAWCAPCKIFAPIFAMAQQEYSRDFIFAKINVDETTVIAQRFGIKTIPTTLLIKGGQMLRKFGGVVKYDIFKQILDKFKR